MPAAHTFDSDDVGELDGPASFKRPSASLKQNSMPTPPSGNAQHCHKSALKRPHVEDVLMSATDDSDDDDDKPLALRKKADDRKFKRINTCSADSDSEDVEKPFSARLFKDAASPSGGVASDDDDSDDDKPLAARFSLVTRNSVDVPIEPNNKALNSSASSAPRNSIKRPCDSNIQPSSALKKAKCTDSSASASSEDDGSDNVPLARRLTVGESSKRKPPAKDIAKKKKNKSPSSSKDNKKVVVKMKTKKVKRKSQSSKTTKVHEASGGGKKWSTLEHNGVIFPLPYKPHGVKMLYNGKPVDLTPEQEEVATMLAVMKDTEYASKETFINNFFTDWSKILGKTHTIKKFELCDFTPIYEWHLREKEKKTQMTSEEKKALREEKQKQEEKFTWASVDGVKEKMRRNDIVEPPGLFRGRGEHPKMGRLKRRIRPSDITINIGEGAPVPVCPIPGESWKEVKHDNTVTWLAFWNDPINQKDFKYVFLAASSSLKGQSDKEKYDKARKLKDHIDNIRANYTRDFRSNEQVKKQIAVATYLIDKLALRAGNEKDDDEADTVGCCTLKVENVTCLPPNKLQFDFLGKDSIRCLNTVEVEMPVYKAIKEFCAGKTKGGHVFDKLDTTKLNAHLKDLMPGLTAKVFRTYNASITLDTLLNKETEDGNLVEKINVYHRANKKRAVPKSHDSQMTKLNEKIDELKAQRDEWKADLQRAKKGKRLAGDEDGKRKRKLTPEVLEIKISTIETKIKEMGITKTNREELKTVALGTSKINYLDPRITVAWCKTHEVPIQKIFSKTILAKFGWAMDVDPDFRF